MATKLDNLLESLRPKRTLDEVAARTDAALNAFLATSPARIDKWDEFEVCLASLIRAVDNSVLRLSPPLEVHLGFHFTRACNAMEKAYGPNGDKAGFEMARTGNEGGLYEVLKTVARRHADQYARNEIQSRIHHYWNNLSIDERVAAPIEYIEKYGHHLPSELTECGGVRICMNFRRVLEEHVRLMQRLRQIGR